MIADPPLLDGAFQLTAIELVPAVALTETGTPGTLFVPDEAGIETVTEHGLARGTLGD